MLAHCWFYDVSELEDEGLFAEALAALPWEGRRADVMRYRFARDRRLHLGASLLAAWALRGAGALDLSLEYGRHGKPRLTSQPHIHFNLSHSATLAACSVSGMPVGVDVEVRQSYDEDVAGRCFTPNERSWAQSQDDPGWAFTRIWTRKESYLKLLGTGLSKPAASFCAVPGSEDLLGVSFAERVHAGHALCTCVQTGVAVVYADAGPRFWNAAPGRG